jgi:arylsulfatase A-like enzyme
MEDKDQKKDAPIANRLGNILDKIVSGRKIFIFSFIFLLFIVAVWQFKSNPVNLPKKLNVIIITVDALRVDHLSCYGYPRKTTPNIDKLASQGVKFTQAITAGAWTVESVPAILTGTYALTHQIRQWDDLRNSSVKTLAQELTEKSYRCVLWSNHPTMKILDISDGFERIYGKNSFNKDNLPALTDYTLTSQIIDRLGKQYRRHPFFFYIHYFGCHAPYRPPAPYKYLYLHDKFRKKAEFVPISTDSSSLGQYNGKSKIPYMMSEDKITDPNYYIAQYDGALSYTDAQIGRLMESLKTLGLDKNTLVILTADHGETLGEHDEYFNHGGGHEESIRVPLIIRSPGSIHKGKTINRQVSLVDIAPTVLGALKLNKPAYIQGESLLAFFKPFGNYKTKYVFSTFNISFLGESFRNKFTLRTENYKLIYNEDTFACFWELYNIKQDPREHNNLIAARPDKFLQLKQILDDWEEHATSLGSAKKGPPLTEEDKKRLRSMGYLQ